MLNIDEKRLKHIYKGELVRVRGTGFCCNDPPGNMHWEKCRYCSWSLGSLLLDFNNFSLDKSVFLLHPADYIGEPSLVTLVKMAKFCEWESELVLSNFQREVINGLPSRDDHKLVRYMHNVHRVSRKTVKWSYGKLKTLIDNLSHFAAMEDAAQKIDRGPDESSEDVVLKILLRWSSEEYRAVMGEHETFVLRGACYELYQEIYEHMFAIYFRMQVCEVRHIFKRPPYREYEVVLPRSHAPYRFSHDLDNFFDHHRPQAKYFTVRDFVTLRLCGTVSNFTRTNIHPLHRAYRSECDKIGDHHQLFRINDNARIVSKNISLQSRAGGIPLIDFKCQTRGKTIKETRRKVSNYNKKQMRRINRLHAKEPRVYMGLSVRPTLVYDFEHDGSCGQAVYVEHQPTWFHPQLLGYPRYTPISSQYNLDKFLWSDPVWKTCRELKSTRERIDGLDECEPTPKKMKNNIPLW